MNFFSLKNFLSIVMALNELYWRLCDDLSEHSCQKTIAVCQGCTWIRIQNLKLKIIKTKVGLSARWTPLICALAKDKI